MKVCHVITRLIVGGAQENTVATCIGLRRRGYDCDLVIGPQTGPEGSLSEKARTAGVPVLVVNELRRAPNPLLDVQACRALCRLFKGKRYELVHTHSGKAGIIGRLAAQLAGVPVVVHTIHGPSFYQHQNPVGNWIFRWLEQLAAEWTTQFVSVADAMTEQYRAAGIAGDYVTIHSGMNMEAFLAAQPAIESAPVVGKVARLFRLKGHEYLLEAAPRIVAAVPNVKFLLVGDGIYRERLEHRVEQMGLRDRFEFVGLVRPEEIPAQIARMNVLVHLSLREGLPRALPQALACGRPVVAFDVDGAREVCVDGTTGCLVRAEDFAGLADAVIRLLQDKLLATKLGAQGRELVRKEFSEELMVQRIDELYQRLR
jgi:glycosyltransferase involved in cell wall biosynthesis